MGPGELYAYIDGGTTQTRVWACRGAQVVAQARAAVGARDTARDGTNERLRAGVRDLIAEVARQTGARPFDQIVAAGMITSPQGLVEVPHVPSPAGAAELRAGAREVLLPDIANERILFVPGVRVGPARVSADEVEQADIMRGEEVLGVGLWALGRLPRGGRLLNLGSHWKAIELDAAGRITRSVSTLSGELAHAVATQTILASALPRERPAALDPTALDAGARVASTRGLARALYCVRLLEQRADTSADERYAFMLGALIASDREVLAGGGGADGGPVLVASAPALAAAFVRDLGRLGRTAEALDEAAIEAAFRAGCAAVHAAHPRSA